MGQQSTHQEPLPSLNLDGWEQLKTGTQSIIWRNNLTKQQIEQYSFLCHSNQDYNIQIDSLNLRLNHPYLVASKFMINTEIQDTLFGLGSKYQGRIFLERIVARLDRLNRIPFPDVLHVYDQTFRGFQTVIPHLGCFAVQEGMICLNSSNVIKVWISQDLRATIQSSSQVRNEAQMIGTILGVIERREEQGNRPVSIRDYFTAKKVASFSQAIAAVQSYSRQYYSGIPPRLQYLTNNRKVQNITRSLSNGFIQNSSVKNLPINASSAVFLPNFKKLENNKSCGKISSFSQVPKSINNRALSPYSAQKRTQIASPYATPIGHSRTIKPMSASPRVLKSPFRPYSSTARPLSRSPIKNYNVSPGRPVSNISANRSISPLRVNIYGTEHTSNKIWNLINKTKNQIKYRNNRSAISNNKRITRNSLSPATSQRQNARPSYQYQNSIKTKSIEKQLSKVFNHPNQIKQITQISRKGLSPKLNATQIYKQRSFSNYQNNMRGSFGHSKHINKINECLNLGQTTPEKGYQNLVDKYLGTTLPFQLGYNNTLKYQNTQFYPQTNTAKIDVDYACSFSDSYKFDQQQADKRISNYTLGVAENVKFNPSKIVTGSTQSLIHQIRSSGLDQLQFFKVNLNKHISPTFQGNATSNNSFLNMTTTNTFGNQPHNYNPNYEGNYTKTLVVSKEEDEYHNLAISSYSNTEQYRVNIQQQLLADLKKLKAKDLLEGRQNL